MKKCICGGLIVLMILFSACGKAGKTEIESTTNEAATTSAQIDTKIVESAYTVFFNDLLASRMMELSDPIIAYETDLNADGIVEVLYYTQTLTEVEANYAGDAVELDAVVLKSLVSSRITFSLLQAGAVAPGEKKTTTARKTTDGLNFTLYNITNDTPVQKFTVQYPYIILEDSTLRNGNEILVSVVDEEQKVTAEDSVFVLDANRCSRGEILLTENGRIGFSNISGEAGIGIVFNGEGDYVGTYDAVASKTSDSLVSGDYIVALMQKTDLLRRVNSVDKLDAIGLIMLMYGKEASNRKQEIDRQHYTIPNQRPKDKHCGKI